MGLLIYVLLMIGVLGARGVEFGLVLAPNLLLGCGGGTPANQRPAGSLCA